MKKLNFLIASMILLLVVLASCTGGESEDSKNNPGGGQEGQTASIAIILPQTENSKVTDSFYEFYYALGDLTGTTPELIGATDSRREREIIFGKSEREVSVEAYRRLERIDLSDEDIDAKNPRVLIYSDGKSVAVAYEECEDDVALITAIGILNEKISSLYPTTQSGVLHKEVVSLDKYYQAIDDKMLSEKWAALEDKIGGTLGKDIVSAMKGLYSLYSDDLISWFANLYDPAVGGFYYSNSARNTDGYLPDAESTEQALRFINTSGMIEGVADSYAKALPEEIGEQIVNFIYNLQDSNGYFYHPQWSKEAVDNRVSRRSRDLSHCVSILSAYGVAPQYKTPSGVDTEDAEPVSFVNLTGRLRASAVSAVSKIIAASDSEVAVDPNLKDDVSFRKYLDSLDVQNNSYSAGNTLTAFFSEIEYRDSVLQEQNVGYSLVDIMIEHLNSKQFEHNGLWHKETNYYAVNGLMKISGVYSKAGVPIPNSEKATRAAMDAITSEEEAGAVTDIYNTWFAVSRMFNIMTKYGGAEGEALTETMRAELLAKAPEAIKTTAEKFAAFRKEDGSFSYTPMYSSKNSQGMPVAVPNSVEGDVNATVICSSDVLGYIYSALGLSDYKVPMCTYNDWRHYKTILEKLGPVIKDTEDPIYEPISFDDQSLDQEEIYIENLTFSERSKASGGGVSLIADPREGYTGNVLKVTSITGTSDSVDISSPNLSHAFSCFAFEGDFCLVSSNTDFPVRFSIGDCYIVSLKISDGYIRLVQSTSGTASKSQDTILCDGPALGEWFSFKVEYYKGDHNTVRIKFYFDGDLTDGKALKLVAVTDGYCDPEGLKFTEGFGEPATQYHSTNLWFMKGYDIVMLMDNVTSYKSNDTYRKYTDTKNPLKLNVDAPIPEAGDDASGIPAYTDTYYNLAEVIGSRYDYSQNLTKDSVFNKKYDSETDKSTVSLPTVTGVSGGKLNVSNLSNWAGFAIANLSENKAGTAGAKYVFDTTFVWIGGRQTEGTGAAAYIGPLGAHKAVDNSYMPAYTAMTFSETDSDIILVGGAELEKGKAYNIRIEYVVGESIHVYVDNVEAYGGFVAKGANADETTFEAFGFYMRKNFIDPFEFTFDNTFVGVVYPDSEGDYPIAAVDPNAPPADAGLPKDLETLYANTEYQGTRYDFTTVTDYTTDKIYNKTTANGITAADIAKVEDGKLYVDNMGLNWQALAFKNGGETAGGNGYTYVFEADLRWTSGHQATAQLASGAAFIGFLGEHAAVDNGYMSAFGYMKFIEGESNKMIIGNTEINRGTTYNLRFEYTVGTGVKMYVNGTLADFGKTNAGKNGDSSTYQGFGIYLRKSIAPDLEFTVDNVYMSVFAPDGTVPDATPEKPIQTETAVVLPTPTGADGIVVLMHDDGTLDTVSIMDKIFADYGLRGNIALLGNKVYADGAYKTAEIAKWQAYLNTGRWQISSHSMTHTFWGLTDKAETVYAPDGTTVLATITEDGMITYEVVTSAEILRTAFPGQRVLTFAYPGFWAQRSLGESRFSAVARLLVDKTYIAGRDAYGNANISLADKTTDWEFSPSYQLDSTNVNDIVTAVNRAKNGQMAVIFTHKVISDDTEIPSGSETSYIHESDYCTVAAKVKDLADDGKVWNAFYEDAVLYTREAQAANLTYSATGSKIRFNLTTPDLDVNIYNYALTVRVLVPEAWQTVKIAQGENEKEVTASLKDGVWCVDVEVVPGSGTVTLTNAAEPDVPDVEGAPDSGDISGDWTEN